MTGGVEVLAVASALPDRVVGNAEIADRIGVTDDWIRRRTGIRERRHAAPGTSVTDLAAEAGRRALTAGDVPADELDAVLVATSSADALVPNTAPLTAGRLGAHRAAAIDIGAACTGWLSALALAAGLIEAGRARTALVIGAEIMSRLLDPDDRRTAALFGDGAGALLLRAHPDGASDLGPIVLRADATGAQAIVIARDDQHVRMDGPVTFRHAVHHLAEVTNEALAAAGRALGEIDHFVYHQANARILSAVAERLALAPERVVDVIDRFANTSAASIPVALADAHAHGRLQPGDRVLLGAFGAGFTWGAGVLTLGERVATSTAGAAATCSWTETPTTVSLR